MGTYKLLLKQYEPKKHSTFHRCDDLLKLRGEFFKSITASRLIVEPIEMISKTKQTSS
jgi:hypothetical protein